MEQKHRVEPQTFDLVLVDGGAASIEREMRSTGSAVGGGDLDFVNVNEMSSAPTR